MTFFHFLLGWSMVGSYRVDKQLKIGDEYQNGEFYANDDPADLVCDELQR